MTHATDPAAPTEPRAPASRRRVESRRRLVEAAREVFAERGIRDTPVELICERAGFTRGAFYSNFTLKEDLFLEVLRVETRSRQRRFAEALSVAVHGDPPTDPESARAALSAVIQAYVATHSGDETWFVLEAEIRLQAMRQPDLRERVVEVLRATDDDLERQIEQFADQVGIRPAVPVRHLVRAALTLYEAAIEDNILHGQPLAADNPFLTDAFPRLLASLMTIGATRPTAGTGRSPEDAPDQDAVPAPGAPSTMP